VEIDLNKVCDRTFLRVGTAALTDPKSLLILLRSNWVLKEFLGLVDFGSLDCLIDSSFVAIHKLPFQVVQPLPLTLIDGMVNQYVTQIVTLPIQLTCGYSCTSEFYVTCLEGASPTVLEHSYIKMDVWELQDRVVRLGTNYRAQAYMAVLVSTF